MDCGLGSIHLYLRKRSSKIEKIGYQFKKLGNRSWAIENLANPAFDYPPMTSRTKAEKKFLRDLHHWLKGDTNFILLAIKNKGGKDKK